jgi:hypothetical protein
MAHFAPPPSGSAPAPNDGDGSMVSGGDLGTVGQTGEKKARGSCIVYQRARECLGSIFGTSGSISVLNVRSPMTFQETNHTL